MLYSRGLARTALVAVVAVLLALSGSAASANEPPGYTDSQTAEVRAVLVASGVSPGAIAEIMQDPSLVRGVPVATTTTARTYRASSGDASLSSRDLLSSAAVTPMALGSSCAGNFANFSIIVVTLSIRNIFGGELGSYKMATNFCHNGKAVTYVSSSVEGTVSTVGTLGGLVFDGIVSSSEGWGNYNGHTNGSASSFTQGRFHQSVPGVGDLPSIYPKVWTTVRYNGTSSARSECAGCTL